MLAGEGVGGEEELGGLGLGSGGLSGELDGDALLEFDRDVFRLVGRGEERVGGQLPHVAGWGRVWVL